MFRKFSNRLALSAVSRCGFVLPAVVPAVLCVALATSACAQLAGKGSITGTVQDPQGGVIPGATVTVVSQSRGTTQTQTSNSGGSFNFNTLDPDKYTITITASGFEKVIQQNVNVNALEISELPVKLTVGSTDQSITVSDAPPSLETSNSTLGGTLEQETYSQLPIQQGAFGQDGARRATDFVALLPGVQFNETNGNATTNTGVVNGGGARGAVSDVYINGLPFISAAGQGDPRFVWSAISVDAVNQLQVQTSGYSAMYEGQGVQNYSIKQGTNAFHGSAYWFFRNTALDTYGFFAKQPNALGQVVKPTEHQNEYGLVLSGPIIKDKMFFFGNYNRYDNSRGPKYAYQTNPNTAETLGDFSGIGVNIYDPTSCPNGNGTTAAPCQRTQFAGNKIPNAVQSNQAKFLQSFLPALTNQNATNNYLGGYKTGLNNYTATGTLSYTLNSRHSINLLFGIGQQQTNGPAASGAPSTTAFNQSPAPYIYTQQFNPATKVGIFEDNYTVSAKMVNQFKYGFARYEGSTFSQGYLPQYSAASAGITNLPVGQASGAFPFVRFAGTAAPNNWANVTDSHQATNAYTLVDNYNIAAGAHSITVGVQAAWLQYNFAAQSNNSSPLTLNFATAQTGCYLDVDNTNPAKPVTSSTACYVPGTLNHSAAATTLTSTGLSYASYLLGAVSSASIGTVSTIRETGARFNPVSLYAQDDWKISPKLTVNVGLRWDYYPPFHEVLNRFSFLDPNAINPITNTPGALGFAGNNSANTAFCNCSTPVKNWYKNFGPRLGLAYAPTATTSIRASYGVIFAHGNGTGGSAVSRQGTGQLGFNAAPTGPTPAASLPSFYLNNNIGALSNSAFPAYAPPPFQTASYGTGYYAGGPTPQTIAYGDPYYGDRAPEFINWSFGIQQAFTPNITLTANYVGSQGHFLGADSGTARGQWINQLNPKYLGLGSLLSIAIKSLTPAQLATVAASGATIPAGYDTNQVLSKALNPFPQYNGITDSYGAVSNSNYHALQTTLMKRNHNGSSFMVNYTWSHNIDDAGTFRSGYAIPAAFAVDGVAHQQDRIERSLSLADRRHNLVVTGVFASPFGKTLFKENRPARVILGGFRLSTIFSAYPGSPLAVTGSACGANPSANTCMPLYNPAYTGTTARKNGPYGLGTAATIPATSYLDSNAFLPLSTPYVFSNVARTSPYGLRGPGNYNLDLSLRRSFSVPRFDRYKLTLDGELFNVTNHTQFSNPNTVFGSATFGTITSQANSSRDAQLSARIEF